MVAPLIRPIRLQGGTFYTFSSASEDLSFSLNSADKKFKFSNFMLLNIPPIQSSPAGQNNIGLSNVPGAFPVIDGSKTENDYLAESFQNYCLNLEALATSSATYNPFIDRTVSERVFYKWMKEIGAIRFRQATGAESNVTNVTPLYVEEDESSAYSRVIKYIGEVNIVNSIRNNVNAFTEAYIYIPSSHGYTPTVLFKTVSDENYQPGLYFTNNPSDPLDVEYLYGRGPSTVQPAGLSTLAFYDSDTANFTTLDPDGDSADFYYYDAVQGQYIQQGVVGFEWWFGNPIANTYFLEPNTFGDASNDKFKIQSNNKDVEYTRSRLDGITVDFTGSDYAAINSTTGITDFASYSSSIYSGNFEFNAVLVYYDVYDPVAPENATKNLFGVLFLDNVDPAAGGGGQIPTLKKYKPNELTGDNGNSYAFRVNLKFDVNAQDTAVETSINDYNPYSLQLYMDSLDELLKSSQILQENNDLVNKLSSQVAGLQDLVINNENYDEIQSRLSNIEQLIEANSAVFASTQGLLNLIQRNYDEINNIYQNKTSVQVAYNLDVIQQGAGIALDKSKTGSVVVNNSQQNYNLGSSPLVSIASNFNALASSYTYTAAVLPFSNYLKITDGSSSQPYELDRDIVIYLDDTNQKWQKGQTMRISFTYGLDMSNNNGNFNLILYSDATDSLNTGSAYSAEVAYITYQDFINKGDSPVIDIVCIDPATYTFSVDIF